MTRNLPFKVVADDLKLTGLCQWAWQQCPWLDLKGTVLVVDWPLFVASVGDALNAEELSLVRAVASDWELRPILPKVSKLTEAKSYEGFSKVETVELPYLSRSTTLAELNACRNAIAKVATPERVTAHPGKTPRRSSGQMASKELATSLLRLKDLEVIVQAVHTRHYAINYCLPLLDPRNRDYFKDNTVYSSHFISADDRKERESFVAAYTAMDRFRRQMLDWDWLKLDVKHEFWQELFEQTALLRARRKSRQRYTESTIGTTPPLSRRLIPAERSCFRQWQSDFSLLADRAKGLRDRYSNTIDGRDETALFNLIQVFANISHSMLMDNPIAEKALSSMRSTDELLGLLMQKSPFLLLLHCGFLTMILDDSELRLGLSHDVIQGEICRQTLGEPWRSFLPEEDEAADGASEEVLH